MLAVGKGLTEQRQAVGFGVAPVRALIGDVGGGRAAIEQQRALAIVARPDLQHGAREAQPVRGIGGRHGDELAEHGHAGAEIVLLEGGIGVAPQGGGHLVTVPASFLICASSLIAASSRSPRLNALSAADAGILAGTKARAMSAAARPARSSVNIEGASQGGASDRLYECAGRHYQFTA